MLQVENLQGQVETMKVQLMDVESKYRLGMTER